YSQQVHHVKKPPDWRRPVRTRGAPREVGPPVRRIGMFASVAANARALSSRTTGAQPGVPDASARDPSPIPPRARSGRRQAIAASLAEKEYTVTTYVRWFDDLSSNDLALVGGKNASLGELIARLSEAGVR